MRKIIKMKKIKIMKMLSQEVISEEKIQLYMSAKRRKKKKKMLNKNFTEVQVIIQI